MSSNSKIFRVICDNSKPVTYDGNGTEDFKRLKHRFIIHYYYKLPIKSFSLYLNFFFCHAVSSVNTTCFTCFSKLAVS